MPKQPTEIWELNDYRHPDGSFTDSRPYIYSKTKHEHVCCLYNDAYSAVVGPKIAAVPQLIEAVELLLDCPALNLDSLDLADKRAIRKGRAALRLAKGGKK